MRVASTKRWVRVIALWSLLCSLTGIGFLWLSWVNVPKVFLKPLDVINLFFIFLSGLVIFGGLWRCRPWGWKTSVLLIPLSWLPGVVGMLMTHNKGQGILSAPFVLIDAICLHYLLRAEIRQLCGISYALWAPLRWGVGGLISLTLFLGVYDAVGTFDAVIAFFVFLFVTAGATWVRKRVMISHRTLR
jgi:hypothetical protein